VEKSYRGQDIILIFTVFSDIEDRRMYVSLAHASDSQPVVNCFSMLGLTVFD
jgi:hypothetical protein